MPSLLLKFRKNCSVLLEKTRHLVVKEIMLVSTCGHIVYTRSSGKISLDVDLDLDNTFAFSDNVIL